MQTPQVPPLAGMSPLGFAAPSDTILDPPQRRTLSAVQAYVKWATQRIETVLAQEGRTVSGVRVRCSGPGRAFCDLLDCDGNETDHVAVVQLIRARTGLRPSFTFSRNGFQSTVLFYPIGAR